MQKPNYEFAKRQKQMKKQKKNEEKRMRKLNKSKEQTDGLQDDPSIIKVEPTEPK